MTALINVPRCPDKLFGFANTFAGLHQSQFPSPVKGVHFTLDNGHCVSVSMRRLGLRQEARQAPARHLITFSTTRKNLPAEPGLMSRC